MKKSCLFVLASVVCSNAPLVRGAEPPPVISIIRESVKEGRLAAHEKVESDWARASRKAKLSTHYVGLSALSGSSEVWFLSAYPSFEGLEKAINEVEKIAPVKSEMDMLDSRDGELRSGSRTMYAVYRPDLSFKPGLVPLAKSRFIMAGTYRVRLGKTSEFQEGGKAIIAAHEKMNANEEFLCYQVIAGAPDGMYIFFTPMESLKMMDEYPEHQKQFAQAMGQGAFDRLMKSMGEVFVSSETAMFSVNPRMSYVSKETEDADPAFWRPKAAAAAKPAEGKGDAKPKEKAGL